MKLIEIWSEDAIQAMLEGSRRNREIFIRISKEMENCGFCKSGDQCSCKIKKLRFEYKILWERLVEVEKIGSILKLWTKCWDISQLHALL